MLYKPNMPQLDAIAFPTTWWQRFRCQRSHANAYQNPSWKGHRRRSLVQFDVGEILYGDGHLIRGLGAKAHAALTNILHATQSFLGLPLTANTTRIQGQRTKPLFSACLPQNLPPGGTARFYVFSVVQISAPWLILTQKIRRCSNTGWQKIDN